MTVGQNIRRLRRRFGETQEELGAAIGLSAMAVSQWENDRAVPRMGAIEALSAHWGVAKSVIVDDNAIDELTGVSGFLARTDEERRLLLLFRDLNAVGRSKLIDLADDLTASGKYRRQPGDGAQIQTA